MSLKVWLPLNGDLKNLGCSSYEVRSANVTVADDGKIGKCYNFNGSSSYINITNFEIGNNWSYGCWVNTPNSDSRTWEIVMILNNSGSDADSQFAFWIHQKENRFESLANTQYVSTIPYTNYYNEWHHFFATFNGSLLTSYIDGNVVNTKSITATQYNATNLTIGARSSNVAGTSFTNWFQGKLNDVRIYDHCLPALEVKEISQGLILHYKLNENFQILNNCYSYPTFNTSSANGGWSHWGRSGHVGTQGQNTDKTYIYNKQNTYSHWVNNDSTATGEYLVYQSPAFEGGYRSLQAIIKEENNKPIDEAICFPAWNARNGGTPGGIWTSIIPLRDGFYLCKCEGISQDGSNNLVGIYVKPGYKIYLSEAYLENDKEMCSEILYPKNYIIDSSGYGNNGIINGDLIINSNTSKYSSSTFFDGNTAAIKIPFNDIIKDKNYTVSCWTYKTTIGTKNYQTILGGPTGFELEARSSSNTNPLYRIHNWGGGTTPYEFNKWNHFCFVHTNDDSKLYVNSELKITGTSADIPIGNYFIGAWQTAVKQNYEGNISDFRIYATALSAEDIKKLYQTPIEIDKNNKFHSFEFDENTTDDIELLGGKLWTNNFNTKVLSSESMFTNYNTDGEPTFSGYSSAGSEYIKIEPGGKTYYYDTEVSIAAGNQFYIGIERYDVDKTARSNNACVYIVSQKPSTDLVRKRFFGTVNLATDGTNPTDTISLRILNKWSGSTSDTTGTATIHYLSLREITGNPQVALLKKTGQVLTSEFTERDDIVYFYKNGFIGSSEIIER